MGSLREGEGRVSMTGRFWICDERRIDREFLWLQALQAIHARFLV